MRLTEKDREVWLRGLQTYHDRGIPIYVDGVVCERNSWSMVLTSCTDATFYRSDYIEDDMRALKEIHFTKVLLDQKGEVSP